MYEHIPAELRDRRQWVCALSSKAPANPLTGQLASVADRTTWATFEDAVRAHEAYPESYLGAGFVFTDDDPFVGIDLDHTDDPKLQAEQREIFQHMPTYAELSVSGRGAHLIGRSDPVPSVKKDHAEIYYSGRYFIMTGDVIEPSRKIIDLSTWLPQLIHHLRGNGSGPTVTSAEPLVDETQKMGDDTVLERIHQSTYAGAFFEAWHGADSEADLSFFNILVRYTKNFEQVQRIFFMSPLGNREKNGRQRYAGRPDLVVLNYNKAIQQFPDWNVPAMPLAPPLEALPVTGPEPSSSGFVDEAVQPFLRPPGRLGLIYDWAMGGLPKPISAIAHVGTMALATNFLQRSFHVRGEGLNCYQILVGQSGIGKSGVKRMLDKAYSMLEARFMEHVPSADDSVLDTGSPAYLPPKFTHVRPYSFRMDGKSTYEGTFRALTECPIKLAIIDEIGHALQTMLSDTRNDTAVKQEQLLLQLFDQSKPGGFVDVKIRSKKEDTLPVLKAPGFSLVGETTPAMFKSAVPAFAVTNGLLGRFDPVIYEGPTIAVDFSKDSVLKLTPEVSNLLWDLFQLGLGSLRSGSWTEVPYTDEVGLRMQELENESTALINDGNDLAVVRSRLTLKALKRAALVAVANNPQQPVVDLETYNWAHSILSYYVDKVTAMIKKGELGMQQSDITDAAIEEQVLQTVEDMCAGKRLDRRAPVKLKKFMRQYGVVPASWLRRACMNSGALKKIRFANERKMRYEDTIKLLMDDGIVAAYTQPDDIPEGLKKDVVLYRIERTVDT